MVQFQKANKVYHTKNIYLGQYFLVSVRKSSCWNFFDFTFLCTIWTCLVKEIVGIKSEVIFEKSLGSWKILGCQTKELEHISQFLHNSRQQHFRCLANFMRKLFWNSWCGGSLKNRKNINHCCCSEFGVGLMCLCLCQNFWEQKCL